MATAGIFAIQNIVNGKIYIGMSFNLKELKRTYFRHLRQGIFNNKDLQEDFKLFGKKNFRFNILEKYSNCNKEFLTKKKQYYIDFCEAYINGYNIIKTADRSEMGGKISNILKEKIKNSPELYEKLRKINTGNTYFKGRHHTEESKRKIGEANKGKSYSTETRKKISEAKKGKHHSEETKQKMREKNRGKNNPFFGRKHSEETKQKIGEASKGRMLGKKHSIESRKKLSEAVKAYWQKQRELKEVLF